MSAIYLMGTHQCNNCHIFPVHIIIIIISIIIIETLLLVSGGIKIHLYAFIFFFGLFVSLFFGSLHLLW